MSYEGRKIENIFLPAVMVELLTLFVNFYNKIYGSLLRFHINAANIFPEHADADNLNTAEERYGKED
ncbi:hypothetical protein [Acetobacter cerevisiae]|uniref:hypothetical protein n=1 Tax=Acetobacter cerevisiae TaxID=178900 RepID=UPI00209F4567|nr:hypothetical protein [Acetobacter cerevisiae]MCP1270279.1 hypothetical protein [Acetobacter cerevisiae]MCP1278232.1 hypothetical protein [Acetobacter cerevisiae]